MERKALPGHATISFKMVLDYVKRVQRRKEETENHLERIEDYFEKFRDLALR